MFFASINMNVLLNWHENVFSQKCPFLHVFSYAIQTTLFVKTPYFYILYKYRLEAFGRFEGEA